MAFRAICVALLLSSLGAAGCGTVANLARSRPEEGGRVPFGGVRHDVWCINKVAGGDLVVKAHPKSESEHYPQSALVLLCAADLPFSLIGDVVTWPYTVAYTFINQPVPTPPVALAPTEFLPPTAPPEPLTMPRKLPGK